MSTYTVGKREYPVSHEPWVPILIGIIAVLAKTHPEELKEIFESLGFNLNDADGNKITLNEFINDFKEEEE